MCSRVFIIRHTVYAWLILTPSHNEIYRQLIVITPSKVGTLFSPWTNLFQFHVSFVCLILSPANEVWGKVIFLHLSVILFTGGKYLGRYPRADTPPGRYTPWQVHPRAGAPPWQVHPWQVPPGRYPPGRYLRQCMLGYGQQAGGTHPTGMHSCFLFFFGKIGKIQ